ncbi:MAG TPA: single-stranded-DNA-specific exonuclease RecJ [Gammaproteobacteria bacterium]|nr:single-stranded-DNA-specific exonuclease RecJ [Gammaproteobacteria bacterium]
MAVPILTPRIQRRTAGAAEGLGDGIPPLLKRLYAARGVETAAAVDYRLARLAPHSSLGGIDKAADLLADTIEAQRPILIVGDFDTDGATSSALAVRALRALGAAEVGYLVPNRFEYGYGLTPEIAALAIARKPALVVTVDNGIANHAGVAALRERGISVLVTDHHLPGETLPDADVIVNPNVPGDAFPSKALAGVGVMFYVLIALRGRLRERGWFARRDMAEPALADWLDLVALGTVADMVPLDDNNRILVEQGLRRMRAGRCAAGIAALAQVGGRELARLTPADLGFAIAPRLNAAGRLDDMSVGIECLLTNDADRALALAAQLDALNRERREIEAGMRAEALALTEPLLAGVDGIGALGLCLFEESWHQGVIGLVAGRVKDHAHRPVVAFARADEATLKGSARSVPGLNIRDVLAAVDAHRPGLLQKFGGHAMAAGLSVAAADFDAFAAAFDAEVRRALGGEEPVKRVLTDGELGPDELTLETAELLRSAGPWGQGFPEPLFDGEFGIAATRVVGERHLRLRVRISETAPPLEAIAFNIDESAVAGCDRIRLVYRPDVNVWRGESRLQLVVEHLEPILARRP